MTNGVSLNWVAYELHKTPQTLGKGPKRPLKWRTDKSLHNTGYANVMTVPTNLKYKNRFLSTYQKTKEYKSVL